MNSRRFIILLLISILSFAGCEIGSVMSNTPTPITTDDIATYTPISTIEVTPTNAITPEPTAEITAESTAIAPTYNPSTAQNKQDIEAFMPSLDSRLDFFGIAGTGHYGELSMIYTDDAVALYEFSGTYNDGMGVPDEFTIQYFCDFERGTVTEKALYNERLDKNEFHSKLHNIAVLKFPISLGAIWSHETTINDSKWTHHRI